MDDSKIFSKVHEAYKESFELLQDFGVFEVDNLTRLGKLWTVLILMVLLYPIIAFIFGYQWITNFGEFVEHTSMFIACVNILVQLVNMRIHQKKIIQIATWFQELKKFDENDIVKNGEFSMNRVMKFWLKVQIFSAAFYCVLQQRFKNRLTFLQWIEFDPFSSVHALIGIFDWVVVTLFVTLWVNSQTNLFMAYAQLTAHLECLAVKFSKIKKPNNAGDSKENLDKLHEIIEIHQKLKR
jgi:hypothetical protein